MMNRNEKLEIAKRLRLSTESELSRDDLEQILDAELSKPEAEMDTELVQQIVDLLEETPSQAQQREAWRKTDKRLKLKQWQPVVSGLTRIAAVGVILVALMFATYGTAQALNWEFLLRWMKPFAETAAGKDPPGVFINDHDLSFLHNVMDVFFKQTVRAEQLGNIMEAFTLESEFLLEGFFLFEFGFFIQFGIGIDRMNGFQKIGKNERILVAGNSISAFFRQVCFMLLFAHGEVESTFHFLKHTAVVVAADIHIHLFHAFHDFDIFQQVHQLTVIGHTHFHLNELDCCIFQLIIRGIFFGKDSTCFADQAGTEKILFIVKICNGRLQ